MGKRISLNREHLRLAVVAAGTTLCDIAREMGLATSTLDARVRGRRGWRPEEIEMLERILAVRFAWLEGTGSDGAS